jgi:MFS family permease
MKASGITDTWLIGIYIFYNGIYALTAYPVGIFADKIGLKKMLVIGLLLFAAVYGLISAVNNIQGYLLVFFLYGLYAAATEGIAKAWISNIVPLKETGTALGTYAGLQTIMALFASSIAGVIWFSFGSGIVFISAGIIALAIALFIHFKVKEPVYV